MLDLKICLVDFSEAEHTRNSIYTKALPRPQLDLLYLATALEVRPNRVTVVGEYAQARQDQGLRLLPWPDNPAEFWRQEHFDVIICLDSVAAVQQICPHLPASTPVVLWTHQSPQHISMMPLMHDEVKNCFQAIVCENVLMRNFYVRYFSLPPERCYYRYPTMVRSLRKRFHSTHMLAAVRAPQLTLAYTAHPAHGLEQMLEMHQLLQQGFEGLKLRVLCRPELELASEPEGVQRLLARCCQTPDVEVLDPMPWPSWVDELQRCHVHCNPLGFLDPVGADLVDPLAAGCHVVAPDHPGLREMGREYVHWVSPEPDADYLVRYTQGVSQVLEKCLNHPAEQMVASFQQATHANTLFTWDLRVWEWESLLYHLVHPPAPESQAEAKLAV